MWIHWMHESINQSSHSISLVQLANSGPISIGGFNRITPPPMSLLQVKSGFTIMASILLIGLHGVLISIQSRICGMISNAASMRITRTQWRNWKSGSKWSGKQLILTLSLTSAAAFLVACNCYENVVDTRYHTNAIPIYFDLVSILLT